MIFVKTLFVRIFFKAQMGQKSWGEEVNCGFMKGMFMFLTFHVFYLQNIVEVCLYIMLNGIAE